MKQIKALSILITGLLLVACSCSLEKRMHRTGYHIDWHNNKSRIQQKETTNSSHHKSLITLHASTLLTTQKIAPRSIETQALPVSSIKEIRIDPPKIQTDPSIIVTAKKTEKQKEVLKKDHQPKPRKDLWAIAGFVLSFLGPISIFGIIASAISLHRIKKNPKLGGRGLAIAGLIIGIFYTLIVAFIYISIAVN